MKQKGKRGADKPYHHGDLETALIAAAVAMIDKTGIEGLSIRNVGARVGVSRNALYRHFDSKAALLARVAARGFETLRLKLTKARNDAIRSESDALVAMADAYVKFGVSHRSQYRVMFGPVIPNWQEYAELYAAATATFGVLVEGIAKLQDAGQLVQVNTISLAQLIWAQVHGLVMLGIDGQLSHKNVTTDELGGLANFAMKCFETGIKIQAPR